VRRVLAAILGAIVGFPAGAFVGTMLGMLWITIFPPDRVAGGPEVGFNTVFGAGLAGEATGVVAGIVLGLRYLAPRRSKP
jgi:hypothetical protein